MESNYELLIRKIDEFIRKYYKNQLLRGLLYTLASLGSYYILVVLLEYFSWFGTTTRTLFFYAFLVIAAVISARYIFLPLSRLSKLGKIISHEQAAEIIGKHFTEVKDTLLNTLQLHKSFDNSDSSSDLIQSSIDQKINNLKRIPFVEAVDLRQNRKYLRYALPPLIFVLAALLVSPSLILSPSERILKHNVVFERPAPFTVKVLNDTLQVVQQDDFTVEVKIEGDEIPAQLFINTGSSVYRMEKGSTINYSYTFRNIQQNTAFVITAEEYNSKEFIIKVLPKPVILSFDVTAEYPGYLNRKSEVIQNTGDLTVPAGTKLTWKFYTRDTESVTFRLGNNNSRISVENSNVFSYSARLLTNNSYTVISENAYFKNRDSLAYLINVIPDLYPSVTVEEYKDSVFDNRLYYQGTIKDDYGFSKLTFSYKIKRAGDEATSATDKLKEIELQPSLLQQQFYYFMDMSTLFVQPGDEVEYFFEVTDNDGIVGGKSTRSATRFFKVPTLDEIEKLTEKKNEDIKDKMESVIAQSKQLEKQVEEMQKKMVEKKEVGWQEKKTLQQILDKQQSLQQQIEQIQNENKEKSLKQNQYLDTPPDLLQKQARLEELFNKVMTEDMKKMYEELQKMLEKIDKEKVAEMLDKIKEDTKNVEKEIDRNLELFKQLEFEQKLQQTIDKLDELAKDQEKLSDETKKSEASKLDELKKEQLALNEEFKQLKDDLDELKKKNSELEEPNKLEDTEVQEKDIEQDMENSGNEMESGKQQKASQSQKSASGKMKSLSSKLTQMQQEMEGESDGEDVETMRQILDNLVKISFTQESLMDQLNVVSTTNPKYLQIIQKQKNLKDDLKVVADSLYAVSKRQSSIEPFILRELGNVEDNVEEAVNQLNNRQVATARVKQQYAMTSVNNLALMLAESLKQMQQNMQGKGSGKASAKCNKPGGSGGKMKSMRQMQEQMNQQLKEMREGMQNPGKPGSQGQKKMSEKLARMAAQQEALRKQMQEYGQELQKEGTGMDKGFKEMMQEMEKTETDLVNKRISLETLKRQQEIVTRMLESEKAEQQRELDQQRESNEAKDIYYNNPAKFFKNNKTRQNESELLHTIPPGLKQFYKSKVNAYFLSFE